MTHLMRGASVVGHKRSTRAEHRRSVGERFYMRLRSDGSGQAHEGVVQASLQRDNRSEVERRARLVDAQ